jgi:hypothetical protein
MDEVGSARGALRERRPAAIEEALEDVGDPRAGGQA